MDGLKALVHRLLEDDVDADVIREQVERAIDEHFAVKTTSGDDVDEIPF